MLALYTCTSCVPGTALRNWCLLMRVLATTGFLKGMLMPPRVSVLPGGLCSFVAKGSSIYVFNCSHYYLRCCRVLVLPAISLDGILTVKVIKGSYYSDSFARSIDGLLYHMNPFPGPNSVIIMDNCRIHHSNLVCEIILVKWQYLVGSRYLVGLR